MEALTRLGELMVKTTFDTDKLEIVIKGFKSDKEMFDFFEKNYSKKKKEEDNEIGKIILRFLDSSKPLPFEEILSKAIEKGLDEDKLEFELERLKAKGKIFEPRRGIIQKFD